MEVNTKNDTFEEEYADVWRNLSLVLSDIISRHIGEMNLSLIPSYDVMKLHDGIAEYYERYHMLKTVHMVNRCGSDDPCDYVIFDGNQQYVLNYVL